MDEPRHPPKPSLDAPVRIRCAIYTRKSTEEGLDQDFNSLQAQREAAEAFIQSQKHLGWVRLRDRYDDGGFSGGSLERPALRQLLSDIEAGRVDCVVVYKVDRLSRSLLDFARLMERFERRSVSFVSVTQQFNTTTSLGRLTLNIFLSFAQFEREIISERTRDKMSAARRKGKWVGGTPVLGYDVDPRGGRLMVNAKEANRVREISELFRSHGSVSAVVAELGRRGWSTKSRKSKRGIRHGGRPFTKAALVRLLNNVVYAGKIDYRGAIYKGEHEAIIDSDVWEEAHVALRKQQTPQWNPPRIKQNALLTGLLFCRACQRPMVATYSAKGGRRYRYYVCRTVRRKGWKSCPTKSVAANVIEDSFVAQLRERLSTEKARSQLRVPEPQWQKFVQGDVRDLIAMIVEHIHYDASCGKVLVQLRRPQEGARGTQL
jgi:site-specific DNA recombinase